VAVPVDEEAGVFWDGGVGVNDHTKWPPRVQLAYTTVRIVAEAPDSTRHGTGYIVQKQVFFQYLGEHREIDVLVTNKHVLEDAKRIEVVFTRNKSGAPDPKSKITCSINDLKGIVFDHPRSDVDLCAIPLGAIVQLCGIKMDDIYFIAIPEDRIPSSDALKQYSAGDEVFMIGYPNGLWDEANNFPVFRKGILATDPNFDYCNQPVFIIDCACFPGSSGSPVITYTETVYRDFDGSLKSGYRSHLLGTLFSGPTFDTNGEIVSLAKTKGRELKVEMLLNLGYVLKPYLLNDIAEVIGARVKVE
jgi:Trypsin-like peptidase domain